MKENMLDVLLYLFEHCIEEGRDVAHDEEALKRMLKDAGFEQTEINKAFTWLEDLVQQREAQGGNAAPAERYSFRVFSAQESGKLDKQCRGFLASLEQSDVLTPLTREIIIERAMAVDMDELDIERFKWIVMMVLANQPGVEHSYDWVETLVSDSMEHAVH